HSQITVADDARNGILVTLHRQETVDDPYKLRHVLAALGSLGCNGHGRVTWPVHPRTVTKVAEAGLAFPSNVEVTEPLGHGEFLARLSAAKVVVTDSGGG